MDVESLQYLMKKEKLQIGYAMKKEGCKRYSFYIYRRLLDAYKAQIHGAKNIV